MSQVNFEYFVMLIYRLKLSDRYFMVSSKIVVGSVYFHYRKIVGGEIINTSLASIVGLKGLYFYDARLCLLWGAAQGMK